MRRALRVGAVLAAVLLASCGGGGAPDQAAATAQAEDGRARALAANTSLAVQIPQVADPLFDNLNIPADAATRGMWGPLQDWPMTAIHAVVLPDGKVLTYGAPQKTYDQAGRFYDVWDPAKGFGADSHVSDTDPARPDSFCSTAAWLGDGRLLITGGNAARMSSLFTPGSRAITIDQAQLADDRWYATMLDMPDGRMVMLGGLYPYREGMYQNPDAAIQAGDVSMTPEIYTPGTGWRNMTGATSREAFGPENLRTSYPRAWVAPNGEIFGISADRMWYMDVHANGGTGAVRAAGNGVFKGAPSNANPVNSGATGTAVMFAPGRVLMVGGNGGFNGDGYVASNGATVVDINGAAPVLTDTANMSVGRRFPNAVVLPNGQVLVTGGTKVGNAGGADANFAAEIWNPATGTWTVGANAAVIRVYHSNTVLLANGTVLSNGGGIPGPVWNQNAEIYYPPYLFAAQNGTSVLAARPVMTGINSLTHTVGDAMQIEMLDDSAVARVVAVRNGTATHSWNPSQRFIELSFKQRGDRLEAALPASANTMLPGTYQVYAINAAGVPSRAVLVQVKAATATLPRDVPLSLYNAGAANSAVGVDGANLGVLQNLGINPSNDQLLTTLFTVRPGWADPNCVSFEYTKQPGTWLRHAGFRLQLSTNNNWWFAGDATFCPEPGLAGHSVTLRSKNYPGYVLRNRDGQIWLDQVANDAAFRNSATWSAVRLPSAPLPEFPAFAAAPVQANANGGATVSFNPNMEGSRLTFSWTFGDGSPATPFTASSAARYTYAAPGVYTITVTARDVDGRTRSYSFSQAVYAAATANAPRQSAQMLLEPRNGASTRLWVVNPDNNSVSVIDTNTNARVAEVAVGAAPRSVARAPNGQIWVTNRDDASISVIDPGSLAVVRATALQRASQPFGLVFSPDGSAAWVSLEAAGRILKLDVNNGAQLGAWDTGGTPRHLSISGDSARLLVSRFITAPQPGEGGMSINTNAAEAGAEVWVYNTANMTLATTVRLAHSDKTDNEIQGRGIPNYLGAAAISPDGRTAWVPSKQDNIKRGSKRSGQNLNHENTVRAISSRINLAAGTPVEVLADRVDHDNSSVAKAAAYDPTGAYLFVALETSRQVAVVDAARGRELFKVESQGFAPQAVLVSPDGQRLYVHNFMSRSVNVVDLRPLMNNGTYALPVLATVATVGADRLNPGLLRGKQLFYDARDPRLAKDSYMSCASCHEDGSHDGRTWDISGFGEGLRNTINLRGRSGMGHGLLHWSGNFDEVQDFEGQIRALAGGTGLMPDAVFYAGTFSQALGDRKSGISADLDALAAYVGSLNTIEPSPFRNGDGTLSAAAQAGKAVFDASGCATCHSGANFSSSSLTGGMRGVGTINGDSGNRLGAGAIDGIDVPTLRGVWATSPYLHNGSAATLDAAVAAHAPVPAADVGNLVAYLRSIDGAEPAPVQPLPNGVYRLVAQHSGHALVVTNASQANAAGVSQSAISGVDNQRWTLTRMAGGDVMLTARHSGKVLGVLGCSGDDGATAIQNEGNGALCARWWLRAAADGSWTLVNLHSNKLLEVDGSSLGDGTAVKMRGATGGANQRWRLEPVSANGVAPGYYSLANVNSGKVLEAAGGIGAVAANTNVQQWTNLNALNQQWQVMPSVDGRYYELAPAHAPGMRLQVYSGAPGNAGNVEQGPASGSMAQRWSFEVQPDGSWRVTNVNSGRVLDVLMSSRADGGNVIQFDWYNTANQRWRLQPVAAPGVLADGVYRLVAQHSGQVLNVQGGSAADGAQTIQNPWAGTDNERWLVTRQADGSYTLAARNSGKLLEVAGCGAGDGARVQIWPANGAPCQRWRLQAAADGFVNLVNVSSGKVLDVAGGPGAVAAGTQVYQWTALNAANQRWRFEKVSANFVLPLAYAFTNVRSGKVLDVEGISTAEGAQVWQWTDYGTFNQRWYVLPTADGYYELAPFHNAGMRLEVSGANLANGAALRQSLANGSPAQRWSIERLADGSVRVVNVNSGRTLEVRDGGLGDGTRTSQWDWINLAWQRWTMRPL